MWLMSHKSLNVIKICYARTKTANFKTSNHKGEQIFESDNSPELFLLMTFKSKPYFQQPTFRSILFLGEFTTMRNACQSVHPHAVKQAEGRW
jgi:hypothetical protein